MRHGCAGVVIAALTLCLGAMPVRAGAITLDFTLKGMFSQDGLNNAAFNAAPGNVLTGQGAVQTRSYFVFDLGGIAGSITSATLMVGNPAFGYHSSDASESWTVFDYTGDIAILQNQSADNPGAYADLGSGNIYGSRTVSSADNPDCSQGCTIYSYEPVSVTLGGTAFLDDINAARGGLFALGTALTSLAGNSGPQSLFGFSNNSTPAQLILNTAVPEPPALTLLLAGLAAVRLTRRREFRGLRNR